MTEILPAALRSVIDELGRLPGVGARTAERYAYYLLRATPETSRSLAKRLTELQLKWDEVGRVPRESVRDVEGRIRKIEDHVKSLEDEHWRKTNPETKARSEGLRGQLEASIAELKAEIEGAKDAKAKAEAEQKLATQESWLAAIGD